MFPPEKRFHKIDIKCKICYTSYTSYRSTLCSLSWVFNFVRKLNRFNNFRWNLTCFIVRCFVMLSKQCYWEKSYTQFEMIHRSNLAISLQTSLVFLKMNLYTQLSYFQKLSYLIVRCVAAWKPTRPSVWRLQGTCNRYTKIHTAYVVNTFIHLPFWWI